MLARRRTQKEQVTDFCSKSIYSVGEKALKLKVKFNYNVVQIQYIYPIITHNSVTLLCTVYVLNVLVAVQ